MMKGVISMESQQVSVSSRIAAKRFVLSQREQEIAEFVLAYPNYVTIHTITDLAKKIKVSESSINRFCKKLGYKGFNDFRMDLVRESTVQDMTSTDQANKNLSFTGQLVIDYQEILSDSAGSIKEHILDKAVNKIHQANQVYLLGNNISRPAVFEMHTRLLSIGKSNMTVTDPNDLKIIVNSIGPDDVVVIIASNLFSTEIYDALVYLVEHGVAVIGLTFYDSPQLNELLYAKFIAYSKVKKSSSTVVSDNFSFIFIGSVIINRLIKLNPEYTKNMMKTESSMTKDSYLHDAYY